MAAITHHFKVGDKVKLPKTKSLGEPQSSCTVVAKARGKGKEFLYITGIDGDKYMLFHKKEDTGDYYALKDLEPYGYEPEPLPAWLA